MKVWFPAVRARTGADTFTCNLAQGLERQGIQAEVTWFPHAGEILPFLMPGRSAPEDAAIIHSNSWYAFAFADDSRPLVCSVYHWIHDRECDPFKGPLQRLYHSLLIRRYEEHSIRKAAATVAISHYTAAQVRRAIPRVDVRVIHPGVDTEVFTPAAEPGRQRDVFRLLFVGTPSRRKGFHLLPSIMSRLGSGFELVYMQGPLLEGLSNATRLGRLGHGALVDEYRKCDALIFPTYLEGFGFAAAEAMACGRPVITSDCSALPELVENGNTGILCAPGDIDAFVDAAQRLRSDPALARSMGRAARAVMESRFRMDRMIEQYADLYRMLA